MSIPSMDELAIRIGTPAEFERARSFLGGLQFNERAVCAALKIRDIAGSRDLQPEEIDWDTPSPALRLTITLFVLGASVPREDLRKICGDELFSAFSSLGLVRKARRCAETVVCPVWLYPIDGFIIASDRRDDPDGEEYRPPADVVFPGLDSGTLRLLRLLPKERGDDGLDLCGGCGIGALHLSRTVERAVSTDITRRSSFFATFNAGLNGIHIESLEGDLYVPIFGRSFDVI